jgi:hypothetical protein
METVVLEQLLHQARLPNKRREMQAKEGINVSKHHKERGAVNDKDEMYIVRRAMEARRRHKMW